MAVVKVTGWAHASRQTFNKSVMERMWEVSDELMHTYIHIGRVSYLIYVSMRHYVLTTSGDIVFNLLLGELYPRENEVVPEVIIRRGGWPGFEVFVWRRLTSCWILSAMSPEIQEWSHKSRSRMNNLYLLRRSIVISTGIKCRCRSHSLETVSRRYFKKYQSLLGLEKIG